MLKHLSGELADGENSRLILIEGAYSKKHWLIVDMPATGTLKALDEYMRDMWLECCDHLSAFSSGRQEISMKTKISGIPVGSTLTHEYDFGSTTECLVTVCGSHSREPGIKGVRTLARNNPIIYKCCECGEPADEICMECGDFYCSECFEKHAEDVHDGDECNLPVCNSPRMGVCGYTGGFED
jgi:hypothetical protein